MEVEPTTFALSDAIKSIQRSKEFLNESLYGWGVPVEQTLDVAAGLIILVRQLISAYDQCHFTDEESQLVLEVVDLANKSILQVTEGEGEEEYDTY